MIERLNYRPIEAAWLAGYESPEWNRVIFEMVQYLDRALTAAETRLAAAERAVAEASPRAGASRDAAPGEGGGRDTEGADALELFDNLSRLQPLGESAMAALQEFFEAANELGELDFATLTPQQQKARLLTVAMQLKQPALDLEERAGHFVREIMNTDAPLGSS